jgi:hypothetical protein
MNTSLKAHFNSISHKVIALDEFEAKAAQFKKGLSLPEKAVVASNDVLKTVTVGFGEIAKDIFGLPTNTGTYEDAQGKFYITAQQFKRVFLSAAFTDKLSEGLLDIAAQCQDHSEKVKSGELKKFSL